LCDQSGEVIEQIVFSNIDLPERIPLSRDAVVRRADAVNRAERVRDGQRLGVVSRRISHQVGSAIVGPAVGVDEDGAVARKVAGERLMNRFDDGANRARVVQRGYTDEHVDVADGHQVVQQFVRQHTVLSQVFTTLERQRSFSIHLKPQKLCDSTLPAW